MSDFYAKFDALKEELSDGLDKTSASYLLDTADGKIVFGVCDKTEGEFYILMVQDCVKFLEVVERKRTESAEWDDQSRVRLATRD